MKADSFLLERLATRPVHAETPAPEAEMAAAAALFSSLNLGEILRGCRNLLAARFALCGLTFVQHRTNDSTVTLFPTDEGPAAALTRPRIIALGKSRLRRCIIRRKKLIVNLRNPSDYDPVEQEHLLAPGAGCVMYLPLMLKGNMKGILVVSLPRGARADRCDHDYLDHVSRHLALAIGNSDAYYLEQRHGRQLSMVSEIARQAVMLEDLDDFLGAAPELLRRGFNYDVVQLWTVGPRQETPRLAGCAHRSTDHESTCRCVPHMVEECIRQGQTLCNNNCLGAGSGILPCWEGIASQLAVPIRLRNKPLGVLCLASKRLDAFPEDDINIMGGVVSVIATTFDNVQLQEQLEALSITDELTGLYNKRHFFAVLASEIERSRRFHHRLSLCFFDLDGLKEYNDTRGHLSGDRALKETAGLLQGLIRSNVDSCFRYGGDEFTVIMPGASRFNAQIVVERIRGKLSDNFRGMITASIGIAECSDLDTAENLVDKADRAMYTAKAHGGNRVFLAG